jgi:2-polyprenyl-3-methyl-5-hydroxy-6-metoxy-1,4-benzoquinol methylase
MKRFGKENVVFRTKDESNCEILKKGILSDDEWMSLDSIARLDQKIWDDRYEEECGILSQIISENNVKHILEVGSGPGILCNKILKVHKNVVYNLIDIDAAKKVNLERKLGGNFFTTDLNNGIDVKLKNKVDLFIANDFLEHIQSPAKVILDAKEMMNDDALAFISVPNWRMGHAWIYRGLFDWDNFIHFMWQHGFSFLHYTPSHIKCPYSKKLDSESTMPDEMINSWNFYLTFKRNDR